MIPKFRVGRQPCIPVVVLLAAFLGALWWSTSPSLAAPAAQIVTQDDVATPTATFELILVPTSSPTQSHESPQPPSLPNEVLGENVDNHGANEFSSYVVQEGDTLLTVALEVGIDVADMPCAISPNFQTGHPLVIGDSLEVPPPNWRCHQVENGESLFQIAARYQIEPVDIFEVAWNQLRSEVGDEANLIDGSYLRIPPPLSANEGGGFLNYMLEQPLAVSPLSAYAVGGTRAKNPAMVGPIPKDWPFGSGNFMWPVFGWMSQGYRGDHRAIDVASPPGSFVTASDRGVVIRSGWNDQGYGMFVVIDHNIDYITLYAHLTDVVVRVGDVVSQGQIIGTVGTTGNSTGPHLHFEIRDFGRRINPLDLLIR